MRIVAGPRRPPDRHVPRESGGVAAQTARSRTTCIVLALLAVKEAIFAQLARADPGGKPSEESRDCRAAFVHGNSGSGVRAETRFDFKLALSIIC